MREQFKNIWPLDRLHEWHLPVAVCGRCAHREVLRLAEIRGVHPEISFLHEVEPWLVCRRCANRERNHIELCREDRNY